MRLHMKIIAAALSAALVVSAMPAPAAAQQNQQQQRQGIGVLPTLVGPIGAAALAGPSSTLLVKSFSFKYWQSWGWHKIYNLKHAGWDVSKDFGHKKVHVKATKRGESNINGKAVVGCIFGSALATITSAMRKASAMGNPPRWRSQAEHEKIVASGVEKKYELTLAEANTAMAFCGLGSFTLYW